MSINLAELKVKKDAAVSALFSLWKAAGDASSATLELIDYLEGLGLDVEDLRAALDGTPQKRAKPEIVEPEHPSSTEPVAAAEATPEEVPAPQEGAGAEEEENGKKKRKRAPRDPNMPKRPLNVQLKFHNAEQKKIQEERKDQNLPELNRSELRDAVKMRWEKLDSKTRNEMLQEHQVALEKWHAQTAAYKDTTSATGDTGTPALSQEQASQETPAESESVVTTTPSKKKHRKSEGKKDEKKRRKKSADSE